MADYSDAAVCEAYEIVQTVEVLLASDRKFRLVVVKTEKGANVDPDFYHVEVYERQRLYRGTDGRISSERTATVVEFDVWVPDISIATYNRSTPEAALSVALSQVVQHRNYQYRPW